MFRSHGEQAMALCASARQQTHERVTLLRISRARLTIEHGLNRCKRLASNQRLVRAVEQAPMPAEIATVPLQENPYERDDGIKFVRLQNGVRSREIGRWWAITQQPDRGSSEGPVTASSPVRGWSVAEPPVVETVAKTPRHTH
jgi:hypothetical protein